MTETLDQYAARLSAASTRLPRALLDEASEIADSIAVRARRLASQRMRAPRGLDAIRGEARASGSTITARVYGDVRQVPWLRIQEEGGTIEARSGGFLAIPQADGTIRRVRRVTLRPLSFIGDAVDESAAEVRSALLERLRRTVEAPSGV